MALSPDLTDSASVEGAFGEVVKRFGRIDILVNNAGISQSLPLNEYSDEEMDKILDLNIKAVFVCCRAAARLMEASGGGVGSDLFERRVGGTLPRPEKGDGRTRLKVFPDDRITDAARATSDHRDLAFQCNFHSF